MSYRFSISNMFTNLTFSQFMDVMYDVEACVAVIGGREGLKTYVDLNMMSSPIFYSSAWDGNDGDIYERERKRKSIQRVALLDDVSPDCWPRTNATEGNFKLKSDPDALSNLWVSAKYDRAADPRSVSFYTQGEHHEKFLKLIARRHTLKGLW